jgi:hypothetical protein
VEYRLPVPLHAAPSVDRPGTIAETGAVTLFETLFDKQSIVSHGVEVPGRTRLAAVADRIGGVSRGVAGLKPGRAAGLAVPQPLEELLPDGLERGGATGLDCDRYLAASLVGAAVRRSGSAALVGVDDLGIAAVLAAGASPSRLVVVRADAATWVNAVEVLIGAVEVVLVRPPAPVPEALGRRITARLRRTAPISTALLVAGTGFPAPVRLRVAAARWSGLEAGHGLLESRRVTVVAEQRAGGSRAVEVYLPDRDGTARPAVSTSAPVDELSARRRAA